MFAPGYLEKLRTALGIESEKEIKKRKKREAKEKKKRKKFKYAGNPHEVNSADSVKVCHNIAMDF